MLPVKMLKQAEHVLHLPSLEQIYGKHILSIFNRCPTEMFFTHSRNFKVYIYVLVSVGLNFGTLCRFLEARRTEFPSLL